MPTPFRNDVDALKTRLTSLDEELAGLRERAREYDALKERLASVEKEHEEVRREIDARAAKLPTSLLDRARIASPCHERWENMIGDEVTRFCPSCQKNVHNISEMTRNEAEAFLESVAGGAACIRMYRREDGTVMTADCPVGVRKKRVKRLVLATVGGTLAVAAGAIAFWRYEEEVGRERHLGTALGGAVSYDPAPPPVQLAPSVAPTFATPPPSAAPQPAR